MSKLVRYAAVRFVLNDIFSGLRADDRQKLLHVSPKAFSDIGDTNNKPS